MQFLKRLFQPPARPRHNLVVYVQPKRCDEVVAVSIDLMNNLSQRDDGEGYFVRKYVSATRCPFQSQLEVTFDKNKNVIDKQVTDGSIVDEAAYDAYVEASAQ